VAAGACDVARSEGDPAVSAWTPPPGSAERKAILDALREEVKRLHGLEVVFVVAHLKVLGGWAWVQTRPQSPDGTNRYEGISALLRKRGAGWEVAELPCTEMDNPECLGAPDYFRGLRARFPDVPEEILPGP
jgi:hypothetical protein